MAKTSDLATEVLEQVERLAVEIRNLRVERDILIGQVKFLTEDIDRFRVREEKMRNTIGWYQDRDTYSEGPPEEWRVW